MNSEQQKVDIQVSDILVSIAPPAVRTLIAVTSSLGDLHVSLYIEYFYPLKFLELFLY